MPKTTTSRGTAPRRKPFNRHPRRRLASRLLACLLLVIGLTGLLNATSALAATVSLGSVSAKAASGSGVETISGTATLAASATASVTVAFGPTSSYIDATTALTVTANSGGVATFSTTISGLTPGDTEHYQVRVTSGGITVKSADASFTPMGIAYIQTNTPGGAGTETVAVFTQVGASASTVFTLQYGLTSSYGSTVTKTITSTSTGTANTVSGPRF